MPNSKPRPALMKSEMSHRPDCDIHKHILGKTGVAAAYDGPTQPRSQWGYMCEECYDEWATDTAHQLGTKLRFPTTVDDRP